MADHAPGRRAEQRVMGDMPGDATDDGAFDAAFGVGWDRGHGKRQCRRGKSQT
jgi:hypothetical protein